MRKKIRILAISCGLLSLTSLAFTTVSCGSTQTITPNQVDFLNKNSLSLQFSYQANWTNLLNTLKDFRTQLQNTQSSSDNTKLLYLIASTLSQIQYYSSFSPNANWTTLGTGWVFDYSIDSISNIVNYYIATNAHVLDLKLEFSDIYIDDDSDYTVSVSFPVNQSNVKQFYSYISQPLPNKTMQASNSSYWNNNYWYDTTNINHTSKTMPTVYPIGQLNTNNQFLLSSNNKILFSFYIKSKTNSLANQTIYVYKDDSGNFQYAVSSAINELIPGLTGSGSNFPLSLKQQSDDFQIMKLSYSLKNSTNTLTPGLPDNAIRQNIMNMLDFNTNSQPINEFSSYISRLNYLINLASNTDWRNSPEFKRWFLFNDYAKISNQSNIIFGGFPGVSGNSTGLSVKYANGSIVKSNTGYAGSKTFPSVNRAFVEVNYDGNFTLANFAQNNNILTPNVSTGSGSSGSMVMSNNYWIGIYWGVLYSSNGDVGYGIFTPIFNSNMTSNNSIVAKYLSYISKIDSNSKLLELFKILSNK